MTGQIINYRAARGTGKILSEDGRTFSFVVKGIIKGDPGSVKVGMPVLFVPDANPLKRSEFPLAWDIVLCEPEDEKPNSQSPR